MWRLPDGQRRDATAQGWSGLVLEVELTPEEPAEELAPGVLVEMQDPVRLYLGEVVARKASRLRIAVEHSLDRQEIARIQEIWR